LDCSRISLVSTDETRDGNGFNAHAQEDSRAREDTWVNNFVARLAALIRNIGNKP
jgi:hypothetical protein